MAQKYTTNELVYFTREAKKKQDFSGGDNCLSLQERFDFLKHYQKVARKWNNDDALNQKAVTEEEINAFLSQYKPRSKAKVRQEIFFDEMTAFVVKKEPEYRGVHLYCGAYYEDGEIVFPARKIRPTPCAFLELGEDNPTSFAFEIFIPREYKCTQTERCGDAQGARIIELRSKTVEKVKIKLFNTGEICAMYGGMWRPVEQTIGQVKFDEWNRFELVVEKTLKLKLNGVETEEFTGLSDEKIDSIFFDGGMYPRGEWRARKIFVNQKPYMFEINETRESKLTGGKKVKLPYAIGGLDNKDHRLYLTKTFDLEEVKNAVLMLDTLDPCGKVWLNGERVLDTQSFVSNRIDVTKYLKKGQNHLKVMVEPRPPEVYYFWHRHNDCYNGWFCGEIVLSLTEDTYINHITVETNETLPVVKAKAKVELSQNAKGEARVYVSECYPCRSEESLIKTAKYDGDSFDIDFEGEFKLWDDVNPVLYEVRVELLDENGEKTDDYVCETGFRTICQKDGGILLNGKKTILNGALIMQFLPPFDEVPVNHNCPTDEQIAMQALMLKKMNGNFMRLHMLGYGSNDPRFARICDRLGIMLIWITRFIDSLESLVWEGEWTEKDAFRQQLKDVINYPSIIMYEGSNEYHSKDLATVDRIYDEFIDMVDSIDKTRLLTPCSHLYYGGGIYDFGCKYYNDTGEFDELGNPAKSGKGWVDKRVIRSAHTYDVLCGYGTSWNTMRAQNWRWQPEMLESKDYSYLITEFAITALPNPETEEARANEYIESYERPDELPVFERKFESKEWKESQAYQALCAFNAVKLMRILGIDGMLWCCLMSGANNGSYMKPPIDFYGYKKLGFYALKDSYQSVYACKSDIDICYGTEDVLKPVVINSGKAGNYDLTVLIENENGEVVDKKMYTDIVVDEGATTCELSGFKPSFANKGYYTIKFELSSK